VAIAPNGITILTDHLGRTAGDGFVQFTSADLVEQALKKHKEKIKHRWADDRLGFGTWFFMVWLMHIQVEPARLVCSSSTDQWPPLAQGWSTWDTVRHS